MLVLIEQHPILDKLRQTTNIQSVPVLHSSRTTIISLRFIDRNSYSDSLSALAVDLPNLGEAHLLAADLLDIVVIGVRLHFPRIAPLHPADSY
jgi:hypothetical protein